MTAVRDISTSTARARLLSTATRIFYADGINGVGVDRIVAEANVTRATFYRHFPGKEDLVVACLQATDAAVRTSVSSLGGGPESGTDPDPDTFIRRVAQLVGDHICGAEFRGCAFINAAAEFPDPESPVHRAVVEHRSWLLSTLAAAFVEAGVSDPDQAARQLMMLRDGAMVAGYLADPATARKTFVAGVEGLLTGPRISAGHCPSSSASSASAST